MPLICRSRAATMDSTMVVCFKCLTWYQIPTNPKNTFPDDPLPLTAWWFCPPTASTSLAFKSLGAPDRPKAPRAKLLAMLEPRWKSPKISPLTQWEASCKCFENRTAQLRSPQVQIQTRDGMLPRIPNFDLRSNSAGSADGWRHCGPRYKSTSTTR
jgi:hypothetical protein